MHVVLFDIDGTLITTGRAGMDAIFDVIREDFGVGTLRGNISFSGRTDRGIARELLEMHDLPSTEEHWEKLRAGYLRRLPEYLATRQGRVLPGVHSLLDVLKARRDIVLGLLTGNVRAGAHAKLSHYGLWDHFAFGGFGDHHHDRDHVAGAAVEAAREHLGRDVVRDRVWVIGDTPLDVRCARSIGARAVAVATGGHPREELTAAQADFVLDDLTDAGWLAHLDDSGASPAASG